MLWLCLPAVLAAGAGEGRAAFERGVAASAAGDHAAAVRHFERAREAGLDTGALHFNLGVAYYRTGRPGPAAAAFRRAAATDAMAAPALYQLGRIAREGGDPAAARAWFRRAAARASTERLREAALAATSGAGGAPRSVAPPDLVYVEVGAGHDSNVALAPDDAAIASEEAAGFIDGYALVRHPVGRRTYLRGSAYLQRFPGEREFDLLSLRAGTGRVGQLDGGWRWDLRGDLRHQRLGGEPFETALLSGARLERRLARRWELALGYRLALARGGDDFGFLDGTGHRLRAVLDQPGTVGWRLQATFERVDRDDLSRGDDFFSYSRDEIGLVARRGLALGARTRLHLSVDWARRAYDGAEVRDGVSLGERDEDRIGAEIELWRSLGRAWGVRGTLRLEQRDAEPAAFDYSREEIVVRLERLF